MQRQLIIFLLFLGLGFLIHGDETFQVLCYHDVRDDVQEHYDPDITAVSTSRLVSHFAWLKGHGYHVISINDLLNARKGISKLPEKAILLTFDDGRQSVYTRVWPLLKVFNYTAIVGLVGKRAWTELSTDKNSNKNDFLNTEQIKELQRSGLVEFASQGYSLQEEVQANPQGDKQPSSSSHIYDPGINRYEDDAAYKKRIQTDLEKSIQLIKKNLGQVPRVMVWPYGKYNHSAVDIAVSLGMSINLTGEPKINSAKNSNYVGRLVLFHNPYLDDFVRQLRSVQDTNPLRVIMVDLDHLYNEDKTRQDRNLDLLVERIKKMDVNVVCLRAFADEGDGKAASLYFPNRHLPVKADLFNHAAWQLKTNAGVRVYACLPVMGFKMPTTTTLNGAILEIYEDLGKYADFDGIFFYEDTFSYDSTRFGHDFTAQAKHRVEQYRAPIKTARNITSQVTMKPGSWGSSWFDQFYPEFLHNYDYTVVEALPPLPPGEKNEGNMPWLTRMVEQIKAVKPDLTHTIFLLPCQERNSKENIPSDDLVKQMELLQLHGVLHIGYYPDDFINNHPDLKDIRKGISLQTYPYEKK